VKITTEVRGVDEILRNVRALGTAFSTEVEEAALRKVGKPIADGIAARVDADHHDTGLTGADIGIATSREARSAGTAAVLVGAHERGFILSFLEFGTYGRPGFHIVASEFRQHAPQIVQKTAVELAAAFKRVRSKFLRRSAA
jgi:HK97 gp10 family phage protein